MLSPVLLSSESGPHLARIRPRNGGSRAPSLGGSAPPDPVQRLREVPWRQVEAMLLLAAGFGATLIPALRVTGVDPVRAMRDEY